MSRSAGEGDWGGDLPAPAAIDWSPQSVGDLLPLMKFAGKKGLEPGQRLRHLVPFIELLDRAVHEGDVRHVVHYPAQVGKAVDDDEQIETDRGWLRVGDVRVGDSLVGSNGCWTRVLGVYPQAQRFAQHAPSPDDERRAQHAAYERHRRGSAGLPRAARGRSLPDVGACYRVTLNDGSSVVCDGQHLWTVQATDCAGPSGRWQTLTTLQLLARGIRAASRPGKTRTRWRLPRIAPVQRPDRELPLDPYLLGCWLGDGHTNEGAITSMDPEILQAFVDAFPQARFVAHCGQAATLRFPQLRALLNAMGLRGNKHVPADYLSASAAQRLALVQGLCDTDGCALGNTQSFCTTNPRLRAAFRQLVQSLGGHVRERYKPEPKCQGGRVGVPAWEIHFLLPSEVGPAFRLPRKVARAPSREPCKHIESIEPLPWRPCTCFTVDAPDKLFAVTRDYILTHNTSTALSALVYYCLRFPGRAHMYLSYSEERSGVVRTLVEDLMLQVGLDPRGTQQMMRLRGGSTIKFVGRGGGISGNPCNGLMLCDDLLKPDEAQSPTERDKVFEWFQTDASQRVHSGGSIIVIGTRFHDEDPSGRLIKQGWDYLRVPAKCDSPNDPIGRELDEYLWPEARSWGYKERSRAWMSTCQGIPGDSGNQQLFQTPGYYTAVPDGVRHVLGLDLARSNPGAARKGDYSVILHCLVADRRLYVRSIIAERLPQHQFRAFAMAMPRALPPDSPCGFFAGPNELGYADEWQRDGLTSLRVLPTQGRPKRVRYEQRMIPLWNEGRILLCNDGKSAEKHRELAKQARQFDGSERTHDDLLDALSGAVEVSGLLPGDVDRNAYAALPDLGRVGRSWSGARDSGDFAPSVGFGGRGRGA